MIIFKPNNHKLIVLFSNGLILLASKTSSLSSALTFSRTTTVLTLGKTGGVQPSGSGGAILTHACVEIGGCPGSIGGGGGTGGTISTGTGVGSGSGVKVFFGST